MTVIEKFETAGIAPAERLTFWNDLVGRVYDGTYVNANSPDFMAQMWCWKVGDLNMIRPRSQASMVGRAPRNTASEERVILHLQCRGTSRHRQGRGEAELHAGDFSLCSANHAYEIDLLTQHELLAVEFPRARLAERVPGLEDQFARRISGSSAGGRIFHDFLLSLWHQGDQSGADPEWQDGVSGVFFDLVALAMRGSDQIIERTQGTALRERVIALVEGRLSDPELRTSSIADELRTSPRTVQNVFAAMGTTPSFYVLERRLKRAADLLMANPGMSITAVAFDLGFNDSAYFTRCFRQHFGTTPSAWRGHN